MIFFCRFFANTGAVAGVFSVAGLIVLAIAIALITNGIRRRRARKFDRELAAATLEAASAPKPIFLDDEDDEYGPGAARGGYGGGSGGGDMGYGGQYSDASSHGTYAQPAMSAGSHGESYGMREMSSGQSMGSAMHNVGPGDIFDPYAVGAAGAAGAAGIGVARARSGRVAGDGGYAAALQEGSAPYAAFAAPTGPTRRPSQNNVDILEAAGMGAHAAGAGALARGPSVSQPQGQYNSQYQPYPASQQGSQLHQRSPSASAEYANLDRSRSTSGRDAMPAPYAAADAYYPPQQQGGFAQYEQQPQPQHYDQQYNGQQYGQQQYTAQGYPQQQQYASQSQPQPQQSQQANRYSVADDDDDAYGGYVAEEHPDEVGGGAAPKFPSAFGPEGVERERERDSSAEDDEPKRVLKVANE
ncbi:hypothetical protein HYPSUDRAFT_817144 [Hypholoma sublateritium FD-334 SS-4]|uniref:Uncharacterized protein n=1 Tax=Hypholoma sublateritium (strain FD-334 SS-4) TaxID=945553 RepID=A0A0D2PK42_HYPSF|nr:hypothetical protein HYPSUDRAFT_817144 [Hypholoma sublateritium FD-334 SS-4]